MPFIHEYLLGGGLATASGLDMRLVGEATGDIRDRLHGVPEPESADSATAEAATAAAMGVGAAALAAAAGADGADAPVLDLSAQDVLRCVPGVDATNCRRLMNNVRDLI